MGIDEVVASTSEEEGKVAVGDVIESSVKEVESVKDPEVGVDIVGSVVREEKGIVESGADETDAVSVVLTGPGASVEESTTSVVNEEETGSGEVTVGEESV